MDPSSTVIARNLNQATARNLKQGPLLARVTRNWDPNTQRPQNRRGATPHVHAGQVYQPNVEAQQAELQHGRKRDLGAVASLERRFHDAGRTESTRLDAPHDLGMAVSVKGIARTDVTMGRVIPIPTVSRGEELHVLNFDGSAKAKRERGTFSAVIWRLAKWEITQTASGYAPDLTVIEAEYKVLLLGCSLLKELGVTRPHHMRSFQPRHTSDEGRDGLQITRAEVAPTADQGRAGTVAPP
ncbi:unnamed protein product [Phytophthora fragariaefolia]|uniref:Unnamed protein product n=1 Tax=Phytophthora fragariaefolia TaxID=1490495 RepID=A0A9W6TNN7_9STRA|nr:unnamed protein product [Phytophthora fragariaefolia]